MLAREEIIDILGADECYTDQFGGDERLILRRPTAIRIIELLKQQPEQSRRERSIKSITSTPRDNHTVGEIYMTHTVICDDDAIFEITTNYHDTNGWRKLPPIPQDDDKDYKFLYEEIRRTLWDSYKHQHPAKSIVKAIDKIVDADLFNDKHDNEVKL